MLTAVLRQLLQGLVDQATFFLIDHRDDGDFHTTHVEQAGETVKRNHVLLDEVGEEHHPRDVCKADVGHADGNSENGKLAGIHHLAGHAADEVLTATVGAAGAHDDERHVILLGIVQNLLLGNTLAHLGLDFHLGEFASSDFVHQHLLEFVHALMRILLDALEIILRTLVAVAAKGQRHRVALIDVTVQQYHTATAAAGIFHAQLD